MNSNIEINISFSSVGVFFKGSVYNFDKNKYIAYTRLSSRVKLGYAIVRSSLSNDASTTNSNDVFEAMFLSRDIN